MIPEDGGPPHGNEIVGARVLVLASPLVVRPVGIVVSGDTRIRQYLFVPENRKSKIEFVVQPGMNYAKQLLTCEVNSGSLRGLPPCLLRRRQACADEGCRQTQCRM